MNFIKLLIAVATFIQVKGGLDIVRPLIKEYKQAQTGATQGIAMTERKSKKMKKHTNVVKGITCFLILATFIIVPLAK